MTDFRRPRIMGIINCTPDSFFSDSRAENAAAGIKAAERFIVQGADILDIGGESTRPGAQAVDSDEQMKRILPVIRGVREASDIEISVDTRSSIVAEAALDSGADIINDISAMEADARMARLAAERGVPIILMHMQGVPETMQDKPIYADVVSEVRDSLLRYADRAQDAGIAADRIILDPGIGFGKRQEDNLALLSKLSAWRPKDFAVLIGLSRKSFLGRILDAQGAPGAAIDSGPDKRLAATLAAHAWCLSQGADILRVHDVKETRQLISVWEALA